MNEIEKVNDAPLAIVQPSIELIIQQAVQAGRTGAELQELLDVFERMQDKKREQQFNAAFAKFKKECPPIIRKTTDEYIQVTRNGTRQARKYASLDDIASVVDGPLQSNGLTYDWGDAVLSDNGCITRKFILRHEAGHSRSTASPPMPIEGGEAYKAIDPNRKATSASPQQRMGVADTYAMRYAMISGLGLTTCDEDSDGRGSEPLEDCVTQEQTRTLNDLMIARYEGDTPEVAERRKMSFLKAMGIDSLVNLSASKFDDACKALQSKVKK